MKSVKSITSILAAALLGLTMLSAAQTASAAENPFGFASEQGALIQLASEKCGAGKCGAEKPMKCGAGKCGAEKPMKCGAGKCGAEKPSKCGAGKCGAEKPSKCGAGKCGAGK